MTTDFARIGPFGRPALAVAAVGMTMALSLALPSTVRAQARASDSGVELTVGAVMAFYADHEYCPPDQFLDAIQSSLKYHMSGNGPLSAVGIEVTNALDGMFPWPWPPESEFALDHDGGVRVTANVFVNIFEQDRLSVDLVAGGGIRRFGEGNGEADFSEPIPPTEVYRIQSQANPIAIYGLLADLAVTDRLSLQGNVRGNTTFTGDLEVQDAAGAAMMLDVGTQSFVQVTVGVGVRLGS